MSLRFFDEIFFFQPVVLNIMAAFAKVVQHSFDSAGTAGKAGGCGFKGTKPAFF